MIDRNPAATSAFPVPPFDPELRAALAVLADTIPPSITLDMIDDVRARQVLTVTDETLREAGIETVDVTFPGHDGAEIIGSVLRPAGRTGTGPGIYYVHGGGMIFGDRWTGLSVIFDWIVRHNAVALTIDYRLAPEFPDPTPLEDVYAGLLWFAERAEELGFDRSRLLISGGSAGGGLAAGATLLARDRGGPELCGQMLMYPMLDDRNATVSAQQIDGFGGWDRGSNATGWTALLGARRGTDDVSFYSAPARATDLRGLPPTFIDCGSAEVFRDEDVAFASAIWAAGGQAELHVWPGGFHAFEKHVPQAALSQAMSTARLLWLDRVLGS